MLIWHGKLLVQKFNYCIIDYKLTYLFGNRPISLDVRHLTAREMGILQDP